MIFNWLNWSIQQQLSVQRKKFLDNTVSKSETEGGGTFLYIYTLNYKSSWEKKNLVGQIFINFPEHMMIKIWNGSKLTFFNKHKRTKIKFAVGKEKWRQTETIIN